MFRSFKHKKRKVSIMSKMIFHVMWFRGSLTLKEPGGRNLPPPRHFLLYLSRLLFFRAETSWLFSFKPCAHFKTIFLKNRTGGYDAALRNRALGPTKNWPKTDFQWKLHTNRVFCSFLFQDTLALCFILFIWFIWSKNMCKHTLTHIIAKKCNFCLKK